MCGDPTTDDPERGGVSGVQPTEKGTRLAYRVLAGSAPTYLKALVRANVTPRTLRSSSEHRFALPSMQARQPNYSHL